MCLPGVFSMVLTAPARLSAILLFLCPKSKHVGQKIKFSKYQGAGNDFVLVDNRSGFFDGNDTVLVKKMCDRRFGIGADGLMLLEGAENADFRMRYFNADGREGSMCGNGGRCIVAFARDLGIVAEKAAFLAVDGAHEAAIVSGQVDLGMVDVREVAREDDGDFYLLDTGSPHLVREVTGLRDVDMATEGHRIRNSPRFRKAGVNVNFVEREGDGYFLRTYERGVEGETLACGTGATAAAMVFALAENKTGNPRTGRATVGLVPPRGGGFHPRPAERPGGVCV